MSTLRQILYGVALLGALALLIWAQSQRIEVADKNTELAQKDATASRKRADGAQAVAASLNDALGQERAAQSALRDQQNVMRQGLAARQRKIEDLKRENSELRDWAAQLLPDAARRLRERPAITGAASYRDWVSRSDSLHPAGDGTGK